MKVIDPDGVELRKKQALRRQNFFSRELNWAWNINGYDKLKPYGFLKHGCIDRYSRSILWLPIISSNNNLEIVVKLYLGLVKSVGGAPEKLLTIKGQKIHILLPSRGIV